jgi:hypothetical protein
MNPELKHNEWFEELCALSAIGECSSSEFDELQRHLTDCEACRELHADFCRIASDDLGSVAVRRRISQEEHDLSNEGVELDEQVLLMKSLERAEKERGGYASANRHIVSPQANASFGVRSLFLFQWLRRPAVAYGAVAVLLCAVAGSGAYQLREKQLHPSLVQLQSQLEDREAQVGIAQVQQKSTLEQLQQIRAERDALNKSLADAQAKYGELATQQATLRTLLAERDKQIGETSGDLQAIRTSAQQKDQIVNELRTRLDAATRRTAEQEFAVENLKARLKKVEEAANSLPSEPPAVEDAQARSLFGARDLHIVDVYDVDAGGKTKRSFGRVYYVEKKYLVFYAFDLDGKRQNRTAAGFQAWGYRQANDKKLQDLGLFRLDDPTLDRWVLEVTKSSVLEHIDAVFVTAESPQGSPYPRGRKLLYANLGGPPNHP